MNDGKVFERDFIASVPNDWFKYRLNDSAGAWQGGDNTRFTPGNICDFIIYNGEMWMLELKSHKGKSIPFSCLRPKQVEGLLAAHRKNVNAGYVLNFRDVEETYYINAEMIEEFLRLEVRNSIPIQFCKNYGILIPQVKKRVRYNYILEFMQDLKKVAE